MTLPSDPSPLSIRSTTAEDATFSEIVGLIVATREKSLQAVNTDLIDLYWKVGEIICRKMQAQNGETLLSLSWLSISPEHSPACEVLPDRTYLE